MASGLITNSKFPILKSSHLKCKMKKIRNIWNGRQGNDCRKINISNYSNCIFPPLGTIPQFYKEIWIFSQISFSVNLNIFVQFHDLIMKNKIGALISIKRRTLSMCLMINRQSKVQNFPINHSALTQQPYWVFSIPRDAPERMVKKSVLYLIHIWNTPPLELGLFTLFAACTWPGWMNKEVVLESWYMPTHSITGQMWAPCPPHCCDCLHLFSNEPTVSGGNTESMCTDLLFLEWN